MLFTLICIIIVLILIVGIIVKSRNKTKVEDIADNSLKAGDYVNLTTNKGKILCKVLYDKEYNDLNKTSYGIQLVALEPTEKVTLGVNGNFEKSKEDYNKAIEIFNNVAKGYTGANIASARCIGSVPDKPETENTNMFMSKEYSYLAMYGWNGQFKDKDTNYTADWEQLGKIGAQGFANTQYGDYYWLASRNVGAYSIGCNFIVRSVNSEGNMSGEGVCWGGDTGEEVCLGDGYAFRPCFTLKSDFQIIKDSLHDGNSEDKAYEL